MMNFFLDPMYSKVTRNIGWETGQKLKVTGQFIQVWFELTNQLPSESYLPFGLLSLVTDSHTFPTRAI